MENKFSKEIIVLPGNTDAQAKLSIGDTFALFQDLAAEHAERMGLGVTYMNNRKCFWITVKTRIHFFRRPFLNEVVTGSTWPLAPEKLRIVRNYSLVKGEEVLAYGKTDWGIMDMTTGKLTTSDGLYPEDFTPYPESVLTEQFERIDEDFSDCAVIGQHKVCSVDIDLGGHMNNVSYVRALLSMFSSKELREMNIQDMEVYFRRSCYEGETLTFKMREKEDHKEIAALKEDGTAALLVKMQ